MLMEKICYLSCDRGRGRRPNLKKDRLALVHYIHDSTKTAKSRFFDPRSSVAINIFAFQLFLSYTSSRDLDVGFYRLSKFHLEKKL